MYYCNSWELPFAECQDFSGLKYLKPKDKTYCGTYSHNILIYIVLCEFMNIILIYYMWSFTHCKVFLIMSRYFVRRLQMTRDGIDNYNLVQGWLLSSDDL